MGMEAYLAELGLTERVLYDAQGNSFDPQAVVIRIAEGIRQWSNGEGPPRHEYEAPSRAQGIFQTIHGCAMERGLPAVESPYPYDLRSDLLADRGGTEPVLSDTPLAGEVRGTSGEAGTAARSNG